MVSIEWCKKQNKGIRFTRPNKIISNDYLRKADEALKVLQASPSEEWKAVTGYYACYNGIYALLQKAGIVCEIHDCTLLLLKFLDFNEEKINFIENLKTQRINAQYYTDKPFKVEESNKIKEFVLDCKQKIQTLNFEKIKKLIQKENN